jgi:hypothetical protein
VASPGALRRGLAIVLFAAIVTAAVQQRLIRLGATLRPETRALLANAADPRFPSYPQFLETVRAATKPGDTIAIVFPASDWDHGYAYGYYRASYVLAGREVLPLLTPASEPIATNFTRAKYIAVYRARIAGGPYRVIASTADGALVQR